MCNLNVNKTDDRSLENHLLSGALKNIGTKNTNLKNLERNVFYLFFYFFNLQRTVILVFQYKYQNKMYLCSAFHNTHRLQAALQKIMLLVFTL